MSDGTHDQRTSTHDESPRSSDAGSSRGPGKRTLVEDLAPAAPVSTGVLASANSDAPAANTADAARPAVQRKETTGDAARLEHQASLKSTDVEIPALEGALMATRQEALKQGLLSKPSFDASVALSRAMARLQPAAATRSPSTISA